MGTPYAPVYRHVAPGWMFVPLRSIFFQTTMTDTTVETPEQGDSIERNPATEAPSTTAQQSAQEKQNWYARRQQEKLRKKQTAEAEELQAKIERGELFAGPDDVEELVFEKEQENRVLRTEIFLRDSGPFSAYKDEILAAAKEPRYASLTPAELAKVVAADKLLDSSQNNQAVTAHATGTGASARENMRDQAVDYKSMPKADFDLYTQKVISGQL
ncbi:hypothetical protein COW46_00855 [Candidatus Gracilibacteria bacterium CG17_big_fil_post_rev_8_21_14_2_50_48_13]|nr:MAG: hypothetical protein COW46_00855 [Candidatus Gracilibacteria bacterium CG17_big_fil_post_rev_8_21_14_2_50_48_13]